MLLKLLIFSAVLLAFSALRAGMMVWRSSSVIQIVKICSCGKAFTLEQWRCLKYVGPWHIGSEEHFELRDCSCGSSITIPLEVDERDGFELALGAR